MPNYDFRSLSSYDFELLSRDLLQEELGIRLESFAPGQDGGIDFRYRSPNGDIIVQCKHYADWDALYWVLKNKEAQKVSRIKPARYVLAVSTPLTPRRKDEILALLRPHCARASDILGREDLNNLLGLYPEVERSHVKLWLTSEAVLARFLQGGIWGDSELTLQRIRQRTCRYVSNASLPRARKILGRHHYCIIAGIPGIGKTTLAEILLIEYVERHRFQAVRIANDLAEIKGVKNPDKRQVFYFDDFLGTTGLDKLQKNEDRRLLEFIGEVAANKKWRFILTTREYILNSAKMRYESLAHPPVELKPCIVELADYTAPIRAKILYNHIFFSDLRDSFKRALLEKQRYRQVLSHKNYNPRIVEHLTARHNVAHIQSRQFFRHFIQNLDNPTRVWDHAFRNQLGEAAQHLLLALCSMPDVVLLDDLESAFRDLYQRRREKLGFAAGSRDFEHALKQLDGNFIRISLSEDSRIVSFHNPSVRDFLENYLADSPTDVVDLIESARFFDQIEAIWKGKRGARYSGLNENPQVFIHAVMRLLPSPGLGSIYYTFGGRVRRGDSRERRISFGLEVADTLATGGSVAMADLLLDELSNRIESKQANKSDLVHLLKSIRPTQRKAKPVLASATSYIITKRDQFEDFGSIASLVENLPRTIAPRELARIRKEFIPVCEDYADGINDDAGALRGAAEDIEAIASKLGVDTEHMCDTLRDRANELDDQPEDDHDPVWEEETRQTSSGVTEDTNAMFENLLREIDERH
jgi:hypothetical protein